jgi:hypothetical protein
VAPEIRLLKASAKCATSVSVTNKSSQGERQTCRICADYGLVKVRLLGPSDFHYGIKPMYARWFSYVYRQKRFLKDFDGALESPVAGDSSEMLQMRGYNCD